MAYMKDHELHDGSNLTVVHVAGLWSVRYQRAIGKCELALGRIVDRGGGRRLGCVTLFIALPSLCGSKEPESDAIITSDTSSS